MAQNNQMASVLDWKTVFFDILKFDFDFYKWLTNLQNGR